MTETADRQTIHATCVALELAGRWRGVLLRGPSGAGKSGLALRLIDQGWRLVADDRCALENRPDGLWASAPEPIVGKIEARGLGIVALPSYLKAARLCLVVDLVPAEEVERVPEAETCSLQEVTLPRVSLSATDLSAAAKLRLAVARAVEAEPPAPDAECGEELLSDDSERRRVVLVTGLSGAGRSTALNILEDLGYEVVDNLPLELVERALEVGGEQPDPLRPIALGIDIRTRNFAVAPFLELFEKLKRDRRNAVELLFLTCDEETLTRRFSETRRRHPLAQDRPLADGLAAERRLVIPLRAEAEPVIDTTALAPGELRRTLEGHFSPEAVPGMSIVVTSFSYRLGLPRTADIVIDARFLTNPHYDPELRPLTGMDPRVAAYVRADPDYETFYSRLKAMLLPLVPRYEREGKSYLTVAFGCTGGRHRSVALAEAMAAELRGLGREVTLAHRDVARAKNEGARLRDLA